MYIGGELQSRTHAVTDWQKINLLLGDLQPCGLDDSLLASGRICTPARSNGFSPSAISKLFINAVKARVINQVYFLHRSNWPQNRGSFTTYSYFSDSTEERTWGISVSFLYKCHCMETFLFSRHAWHYPIDICDQTVTRTGACTSSFSRDVRRKRLEKLSQLKDVTVHCEYRNWKCKFATHRDGLKIKQNPFFINNFTFNKPFPTHFRNGSSLLPRFWSSGRSWYRNTRQIYDIRRRGFN